MAVLHTSNFLPAKAPANAASAPYPPRVAALQADGTLSQTFYRFLHQLSRQAYEGDVPNTLQIISPQFLPTSPAQLFSAASPVRMDTVVVSNNNTAAVWIYLYLVPSGQSPVNSNLITQQAIPAESTVQLTTAQGHLIPQNASLYGVAVTASAVSITATGVLV